MNTTKITLWFVRESELARFYCKLPPHRRAPLECTASDNPGMDFVWIPKSVIEHTSKEPSGMHILTLPDWFITSRGL